MASISWYVRSSAAEIPPSVLMFVVPGQRVATVGSELKDRCYVEGLEWADAPGESAVMHARVDGKTMSVASWEYVLERLLDAARSEGHDTVRDDILQLQAPTSRMNIEAFLPLREDGAIDQEVPRRLINYVDSIGDIIGELERNQIAGTKGLTWGNTLYTTGRFFRIHAHEKFESWLGIDLEAWRDEGISPLRWRFRAKTGVIAGHFKAFPELLKDLRSRDEGLYVPQPIRRAVRKGEATSEGKRVVYLIIFLLTAAPAPAPGSGVTVVPFDSWEACEAAAELVSKVEIPPV